MDLSKGRDPSNSEDVGEPAPSHKTTERILVETPPRIESLHKFDERFEVDPVNLTDSLAISSSTTAPDSFLDYQASENAAKPIKFANADISFDENHPYSFRNGLLPPHSGLEAADSPGSIDLPLFSSNSGGATPAQTPKLENGSFDSLDSPYICDKSGSYASVEELSLTNADVSSLLRPPETPRQLQNSLTLDPDVYSDSDGGREGFNPCNSPLFYSSALELEGPATNTPSIKRKRKPQSQMNILTPPPATGKPKKTTRRRSRNSEATSEKSHRSDFHLGSGYTQTPTSGKIFRNLLILEESLRQQVIQQRTLRRKYVTFLAVLCSLIAGITHHLYVSQYRGPFRVLLQLLLLMLVVTLLLYHLSGEYQKTIVLPRKFLSSTNKGLRQLNVRLVKIKTTYTDSSADLIREFGLFLCSMALKFCHTAFPSMILNPKSKLEIWLVLAQLRCQPRFGLNDVKLVLIPRSFSTDIREGWELYRNEFWVNEGVRRRNAALEFTRPKAPRKMTKDKIRKRRPSAPPLPHLSEHNLNLLDESQEALGLDQQL